MRFVLIALTSLLAVSSEASEPYSFQISGFGGGTVSCTGSMCTSPEQLRGHAIAIAIEDAERNAESRCAAHQGTIESDSFRMRIPRCHFTGSNHVRCRVEYDVLCRVSE